MPAYNSNFITPLSSTGVPGTTVTPSVGMIEVKELLIVAGEMIFSGPDYDMVEQLISSSPLTMVVDVVDEPPPILPPPTPPATDSLIEYVVALNYNQYPAGLLSWPITTEDGTSHLGWNGDPAYSYRSTTELPFLGENIVKGVVRQYNGGVAAGGWAEPSQQFVWLTSQYPTGIMSGDFTYEQFVAGSTEFDGVWLDLRKYGPPGEPYIVSIRFGRNMGADPSGSIIMEAKILLGYSGLTPLYATITAPNLPAALSYYHICIERHGLIVSIYLNGVLVGFALQDLAYDCEDLIRIWAPYYAQYRLTVGAARYQAPFTPELSLFPNI